MEGVFLFLFQPSDSLCLIFKHPLFFGILFMGAARRAAQHDLQSWLSAPLEILQFPRTDSLTLFASYGSVCRMLYDNDGKKRLFKKRHGQSLTFLFKAIRSLPKAMAIRMWFTVLAPKSRCQRVSRPAEPPRQPLAGPDVNLSIHPAPIIQPLLTLLYSKAPPVSG